jgi:hypothetical protein
MRDVNTAPARSRTTSAHRAPADRAYRRAWWSLALYPVTLAAAFAIGEGLFSARTNDQTDAVRLRDPRVLAVTQGRRAMGLGRRDGRVPAIVGATIAVGFVGLNTVSYVAVLIFG